MRINSQPTLQELEMKKTTAAAALFLAFSSMAMSAAHADVIYYFSQAGLLPGGTNVQTNGVFASATFANGTLANTVDLTMKVESSLDSGAYVNDWAFNMFSGPEITEVVAKPANDIKVKVQYGSETKPFFSTGDIYELIFRFSSSNPGEIQRGTSLTYTITGKNGLTEDSFATSSNGIFSAIHVQGFSQGGSGVFISGEPGLPPAEIPEPTTVALLGLGLLGFAAARRKAGKSRAA
jgi:hypothetical protein